MGQGNVYLVANYKEETGMKSVLKTLAFGCLFSVASLAQAQQEMPTLQISQMSINREMPLIDLTVLSSSETPPDVAVFSTGVESKALKAREAIRLNAEKMQAVMTQLKAQGVAEADIQTSGLSLTKEYTYLASGKTRFKGYLVNNSVTVKLRDLSKLGDMLDLLATQGSNEFSGPDFDLENDAAASTAARDKAWAMADAQARYHAKKAGYSNVRVVRVSESVQQRQNASSNFYEVRKASEVLEAADAAAGAAATSSPIAPGTITTTIKLSISYEMIK
jgi:uncharacterized protein